jgi:hypothetical protein
MLSPTRLAPSALTALFSKRVPFRPGGAVATSVFNTFRAYSDDFGSGRSLVIRRSRATASFSQLAAISRIAMRSSDERARLASVRHSWPAADIPAQFSPAYVSGAENISPLPGRGASLHAPNMSFGSDWRLDARSLRSATT